MRFRVILVMISVVLACMIMGTCAYGYNVTLDVTVSNAPGTSSPDPYSPAAKKDDNVQLYYVKLTSLTNGPSVYFTAYQSGGGLVSSRRSYTVGQVNALKSFDYDNHAYTGFKYYLYASAPQYYANVHAIGTYCP